MSKYGVISGPCFPVFGLNKEIYGVNLRIQSEYRKIRTRNNSVFRHFSRSVIVNVMQFTYIINNLLNIFSDIAIFNNETSRGNGVVWVILQKISVELRS